MRDDVRSYGKKAAALIAVAVFCVSSTAEATQQLNQATSQVNNVTQGVTSQINGQISGLTQGVTGQLTSDVTTQINGLTAPLSGLASQASGLVQGITAPLNGVASQLSNVTQGVTSLTQGITSQIGGLTQDLTGPISSLTSQVGGLTSELNGVTSQLTDVTQGLTSQLGGITSQIGGITGQLNGLTQGLTSQLGSVTGQLTDITQGLTSQLSGVTSQLNGLTSQLSGLTSQLNGLTSQLSGLTSQLNGLTSQLGGLTQDLTGAIGQVNQAISDATQAMSQATQAISQATQALGQASQAVSQAIGQASQAVSQVAQITEGGGDNPMFDPCPIPVCLTTSTPNKDMRYTNAIKQSLQGAMKPIDNTVAPTDNPMAPVDPGLQGSMPSAVMTNKSTPALSLVKTFPWLYRELDASAQGTNYRGTANEVYTKNIDSTYDKSVVSTMDTTAVKPLKCVEISPNCPSSGTTTNSNPEIWTRLQKDSCSNQYTLSMAMTPSFVFSQTYRQDQYPFNETVCQPLHLVPLPCIIDELGTGPDTGNCKEDMGSNDKKLYDYRAWGYLESAWISVLSSDKTNPYAPNGGQSGNDVGKPPVINGASGTINGPGIGGEEKFGQPLNPMFPGGTGEADVTTYTATPLSTQPLLTRVNDLAQHPYERIWDPTHPYSPRWDFQHADRDFSDNARLNGVDWHGYDPSPSPCIVRCASVPVDILSFRATEFAACMGCRITVNTTCFWTQVQFLRTTLEDPPCPSDPAAVADTVADNLGCHAVGLGNLALTCKTTLSLMQKWPPCSTKFDHHLDNVPPMCSACVALANDNNPNDGVKKCCDDLAHALAPINTLKIRNIEENPEMQPIAEGYAFKQYFGNHMPYMRWWDTGTAAGGPLGMMQGEETNYNPYCDMGQYDAVVGVGIEGKSCKYGGGAGLSYECINIPATDALTSWEELKQYQSNSMRDYGLNCLPQYEKVYKPFSGEDAALSAVGGYFISATPVVDSTGKIIGSESKTNQWSLGHRGYNSAGEFPCFGSKGGSGGCQGTKDLDNVQVGDIIFLTHNDVAPNVAATASSNAPTGANGSVMPFEAVVTSTSWAKGATPTCSDFIDVVDGNNGKYPDVCGNTNYIGMGIDQPRRIYKSSLPASISNSLYPTGTQTGSGGCQSTTTGGTALKMNNQGNCNDPKQAQCTFGETMWHAIQIYTPTKDVRSGN